MPGLCASRPFCLVLAACAGGDAYPVCTGCSYSQSAIAESSKAVSRLDLGCWQAKWPHCLPLFLLPREAVDIFSVLIAGSQSVCFLAGAGQLWLRVKSWASSVGRCVLGQGGLLRDKPWSGASSLRGRKPLCSYVLERITVCGYVCRLGLCVTMLCSVAARSFAHTWYPRLNLVLHGS